MAFDRSAGILLHPTSLHGRFGIGDLGVEAYQFIDWLELAGGRIWQILPLGPTGYGDSPYQCFSAFAGNPMLISPDYLAQQNYLAAWDLEKIQNFPSDQVDFGAVIPAKMALLRTAFANFKAQDANPDFHVFCHSEQEWLDDYALFMACKLAHDGAAWTTWEPAIALREPGTIKEWTSKLEDEVMFQKFMQWCFFSQWNDLKTYANAKGIHIIGDVPIFVAHDSADVWANRDQFLLDESGNPIDIAGVPPDYFSPTGQRWGNPLYRWDVMERDDFAWWRKRVAASLNMVDIIRMDHFRGFAGYWAVPASEETAMNGEWRRASGQELFASLKKHFGALPIIAEDLGVITPDVVKLRDDFELPGMRILQFAFTSGAFVSNFLPHTFIQNCVAYSGSHDNDTTRGWYNNASEDERHRARLYLNCTAEDIVWAMIRTLYASVANTIVVPMQDVLDLDSDARMNRPGYLGGNWSWRIQASQLSTDLAINLHNLAIIYSRLPEAEPVEEEVEKYFALDEDVTMS